MRARHPLRRAAVIAVIACLGTGLVAAPAATPAPASALLRFGLYPGGSVGTTSAMLAANPVDERTRLRRIRQLRGPATRFVLHEYVAYRDEDSIVGAARHVDDVLDDAAATGSQVEVVLRYQPTAPATSAVPGFYRFVDELVRRFATAPALVGIQVTNEPNLTGSPHAADGAYPGVRDALVYGIEAAAGARAAAGRPDLPLGFNLALGRRDLGFWQQVAATGGPDLAARVGYVGLDFYPGTWPVPARRPPSDARVRRDTARALRALAARTKVLGLPPGTAIHFAEMGYPTGPRRTERTQARVMRATIASVQRLRATYNITDVRWFDLRDADSRSRSFQARYGLLRDDLTPKRAFRTLRRIIARNALTR